MLSCTVTSNLRHSQISALSPLGMETKLKVSSPNSYDTPCFCWLHLHVLPSLELLPKREEEGEEEEEEGGGKRGGGRREGDGQKGEGGEREERDNGAMTFFVHNPYSPSLHSTSSHSSLHDHRS